MRHGVKKNNLSRDIDHRRSLLRNLAISLIKNERIMTTKAKAKEARKLLERVITYAKENTLHARRLAFAKLGNKEAVKKLFNELGPRYSDRKGGYTRILKYYNRKGDNAEICIWELVDAKIDKKKNTDNKEIQKNKTQSENNTE